MIIKRHTPSTFHTYVPYIRAIHTCMQLNLLCFVHFAHIQISNLFQFFAGTLEKKYLTYAECISIIGIYRIVNGGTILRFCIFAMCKIMKVKIYLFDILHFAYYLMTLIWVSFFFYIRARTCRNCSLTFQTQKSEAKIHLVDRIHVKENTLNSISKNWRAQT